MKKDIGINKKIKREILKGLKRIYWSNYTKGKYFILTLIFVFKKKKSFKE